MSAPVLRPFHDPAEWPGPWANRKVLVALKDLLDMHGFLVAWNLGHAGVLACGCPLAKAARQAWYT